VTNFGNRFPQRRNRNLRFFLWAERGRLIKDVYARNGAGIRLFSKLDPASVALGLYLRTRDGKVLPHRSFRYIPAIRLVIVYFVCS